jgi:hypothetical protein
MTHRSVSRTGLLLAGVSVLGIAIVWLKVPTETDVAAEAATLLPIEVSPTEMDLGRTTAREDRIEFIVRNTSDRPLEIVGVNASCGCMNTKVDSDRIAPGESTTVTTDMSHSQQKGQAESAFLRSLTLSIETVDGSEIDGRSYWQIPLPVRGVFVSGVWINKFTLLMEVEEDADDDGVPVVRVSGELPVYLSRKDEFSLREITVISRDFDVQVVPEEPVASTEYGGCRQVTLRVHGTARQLPADGTLRLRTDAPGVPLIHVNLYAKSLRKPPVSVTPDRIAFGVFQQGSAPVRKVVLQLSPDAPLIAEIQSSERLTVASSEPVSMSDGGRVVTLTISLAETAVQQGAVDDRVVVRLEPVGDADAALLTIPVTGFVRGNTARGKEAGNATEGESS